MPAYESRRPARRTALLAGTGAVVLVAVLAGAVALAQQRSADDAAATPAPTSSVSPTTGASASSADASQADASQSPAWPTAVTEADLMASLGSVSAVWLDVWPDDGSTPPLPVEAELADRGYDPSPLRVACLDGSVEQLGLDPTVDHWGRPLFFRSAEDADAFATLWSEPVAGVTEGSIACDWG
ncbi:hypothetical protein ACGIF2_15960 [Cellulomonas sp. P22]|uniref:hypothetical protein n=1 Tax=Cellulomonas sp. P22 TaxID=3373189 RepID=UPI0037BC96E4